MLKNEKIMIRIDSYYSQHSHIGMSNYSYYSQHSHIGMFNYSYN